MGNRLRREQCGNRSPVHGNDHRGWLTIKKLDLRDQMQLHLIIYFTGSPTLTQQPSKTGGSFQEWADHKLTATHFKTWFLVTYYSWKLKETTSARFKKKKKKKLFSKLQKRRGGQCMSCIISSSPMSWEREGTKQRRQCNREEQIWLHIGSVFFPLNFVFYCLCYKLRMLPKIYRLAHSQGSDLQRYNTSPFTQR